GAQRIAQALPRRAAWIERTDAPSVLIAVVRARDHTVVIAGLTGFLITEHRQTHELPVLGTETQQTLVAVGAVLQIRGTLRTFGIGIAITITITITIAITIALARVGRLVSLGVLLAVRGRRGRAGKQP